MCITFGYNLPCPSPVWIPFVGSMCICVLILCMRVTGPGGFRGHPMSPNIVARSYDNSSTHAVFTCHTGSRWSHRDSLGCTLSVSGMFLRTLSNVCLNLIVSPYTQLYTHSSLHYLLGMPPAPVSHMSRVMCVVSILLCCMFHQCEFLQHTSEHMCPVTFVCWRYTHRRLMGFLALFLSS